jgi:hypothetical protein
MKQLLYIFAVLSALICSGQKTIADNERGKFDFKITTGLSLAKTVVERKNGDFIHRNDNESVFGVGLEAEYFLPRNNQRWSLFVQPNVQYYETGTPRQQSKPEPKDFMHMEYNFIQIPVGIRYYIPLKNSSKIFINASYTIIVGAAGNITFNDSSPDKYGNEGGIALGGGYNYKRISIELRYDFKRNITYYTAPENINYSSLGLIGSFRLF